jgi:surface polysaccharide O-acyltransferase-like enzyme
MTVVEDRVQSRLPTISGQAASTMLRAAATAPRVVWLDVLRVTAILAVITIHTVSPLTAGATVPTFSTAWWIGASMNIASLWCVPVFVMISGGLLLSGADRKRQSAAVFYRRRLQRIGIPLVFWTGVYLALRPTLFGEHFTGAQAIHDLAIGHPYLQMYYLFVIAGLYALTPALRHIVARCSPRRLMQVAVAVMAFDVIDYTLSSVVGAGGANALTEWLPFLGYFLAGAWLISAPLRVNTERRAAAALVSSFVATVLLSALFIDIFGWTAVGRYFLGYQSPTVAIMSCAVFLWVRARAQRRAWAPRRGITRAGAATFGVFLIHPLMLVPLLQHLGRPAHPISVALGVPAIVLGVAAVTTLATLVLIRVPVLRRLVG